MTKITPFFTVSYKGVFRPTGIPFEIDEKDRDEMSKYGVITATEDEKPARKSGRPKKVVES